MELQAAIVNAYQQSLKDEAALHQELLAFYAPRIDQAVEDGDVAVAVAWIRKIPDADLMMLKYAEVLRQHREVVPARLPFNAEEEAKETFLVRRYEALREDLTTALNAFCDDVQRVVEQHLKADRDDLAIALLATAPVNGSRADINGAHQIRMWRQTQTCKASKCNGPGGMS